MTTDERTHKNGVAVGLAVGLASVAVLGLGAIALYLMLFRKSVPMQGSFMPNINLNFASPYASPQLAGPTSAPLLLPASTSSSSADGAATMKVNNTKLNTYSVPAATPIWVAGASAAMPCLVTICPVDPPAAFIALAYSASSLQSKDFPQSDVFIVPVGARRTVQLSARQSLFARGITPGGEKYVTVSVAQIDTPDSAVVA